MVVREISLKNLYTNTDQNHVFILRVSTIYFM